MLHYLNRYPAFCPPSPSAGLCASYVRRASHGYPSVSMKLSREAEQGWMSSATKTHRHEACYSRIVGVWISGRYSSLKTKER
ncbi:hypothetical protein PoB_007170900 [Plakobranchus ocellatus]|uniref:Uncharacterized protein n=1 Tax=Plakobranchus ocellatus TaxID=259542 RepID=A0AAV4DM05_9GAST|nr:hypothetical protein PoB_007170900 [Plakobranchus ocellatus]